MTSSIDERLEEALCDLYPSEWWTGDTEKFVSFLAARGLMVVEIGEPSVPRTSPREQISREDEPTREGGLAGGSPVSNGLKQAEIVCSMDNSPLRDAVAREIGEDGYSVPSEGYEDDTHALSELWTVFQCVADERDAALAKLALITGDEAVDMGAMRMHMGDIDPDGWEMLPKGEKQRASREFRAALTAAVASVEQGKT